jgi:two-component system sensor kinase FixL
VEVSVADTGSGIDPEIRGELFQPFASTKQSDTGLGLSVSRTIIEARGGRVWNEPNLGGGTVFRFTLPSVLEAEMADIV